MNAVAPPPVSSGNTPSYMAWSIISTVVATLSCCPLGLIGIVAIVFSSKVNKLLALEQFDAAQRASKNAKIWCWVTTVIAIIGVLTTIYFQTVGKEWLHQYLEQLQQQAH
jgi:hypothetical protein